MCFVALSLSSNKQQFPKSCAVQGAQGSTGLAAPSGASPQRSHQIQQGPPEGPEDTTSAGKTPEAAGAHCTPGRDRDLLFQISLPCSLLFPYI